MSRQRVIQVFEYQVLRYDSQGLFRKHHFEAMVQFNEKHGNKYYTVVHKGVRFDSYVGVLQVGGLTIEILPKADNNPHADMHLWQGVLLDMLYMCHKIRVDHQSEAALRRRHNSILDIYFELFLNETEEIVKRGLIRKYRQEEGNQSVLRGKILFSLHIRQNMIHKEQFYCQHQIYDRDHLIHHIIYRALYILKDFIAEYMRDRLNRLLSVFQDYELRQIDEQMLNQVVYDRNSSAYRPAVEIARIIILNYSPNLQAGSDNLLTLLFDMNSLWEEYIYRVLHKYRPRDYEVIAQDSMPFWESRRIRPDIVIRHGDETWIIDTKWKVLDNNNVADDDLKQMFVYNLHWKAERSMLLYPCVNQSDSEFGHFHYNRQLNSCKLGFVRLADDQTITPADVVAEQVYRKLRS